MRGGSACPRGDREKNFKRMDERRALLARASIEGASRLYPSSKFLFQHSRRRPKREIREKRGRNKENGGHDNDSPQPDGGLGCCSARKYENDFNQRWLVDGPWRPI